MGMKRILIRTLKIFAAVLVALVVIYLYAIGSLDNDPHGTFASYGFFPHHVNDVLRFEHGKVTLETCCGDEDYGTYEQDSQGWWVWKCQHQMRPADRTQWRLTEPEYYRLHRSLFHLRVELQDRLPFGIDMRRRLFTTWPL